MECHQDIPEFLDQFKPKITPDAPLFAEDDEDDEDDEGNSNPVPAPNVAQGATWDEGDSSAVFQGDGLGKLFLDGTKSSFH